MVRKCGAKLEIAGEVGKRADAEGRTSRHIRSSIMTPWRRGRHGRSKRRVGWSNCRCFLHCLSVCAARRLLPLLGVAVSLFVSGPGHNSVLGTPGLPCEVELRERLNAGTPWPIMLNVRVRRQIDAETKSSFPATLADTESTCSIAITKSRTLNFARLRCDRQHPCGACSRRNLTDSCNYATTSSSTPDAQRSVAPRQSTSLHGRISELESLVVTLMNGHSLPSPPAPESPRPSSLSPAEVFPEIWRPRKSQDEAASPADPGTLKLRESGTSYVQSVHWEAILTKIRGLKEDVITDSKAPRGSHLFYGPNRHATRDEILAAVPPRPVVDRLMALHFDSYHITPCQYN